MDAFEENIEGVRQLVEADTNKVRIEGGGNEGVAGDYEDVLKLPMEDTELLELRDEWQQKSDGYMPRVKARQDMNKVYYQGKQRSSATQRDKVVPSNILFEAEETFIPQALSKNPEPVVWSDNTDEGKSASNNVKTMLQYHADVLCLRKKLGVMVRHWSIYFIGVVKHGWDSKANDIRTEIVKPQNLILDPDGYIDEYGNYIGAYLGQRMQMQAKKLIELYPKHKDYILEKVSQKKGTSIIATEWRTDEYCFITFEEKVLDKYKNEFFNYPEPAPKREDGDTSDVDAAVEEESATPTLNHFATPKMPFTFLSVFSLQETPHDITNLVEQNIPNQDRINDRDDQIGKNLRTGNNSIALSGISFTQETAHQAAMALEDGDPVLVPDGQVENAIKRLPANALPSGVLESQEIMENKLRSIFGTQGLSANQPERDTTARGMILNQSHDSSRISGGIGDALEQVADNIFNWWLQLYCVFYDVPHYGAIMGNGRAVEYVSIVNTNLTRKFVISVAPNSMQPKDEITQQNLALQRWEAKAIDPISFMKEINDPDPMNSAKKLVLWTTNPAAYAAMFFPETMAPQQQGMGPQAGPPPDGAPVPPQAGDAPAPLSEEPASAALNQVPINTP